MNHKLTVAICALAIFVVGGLSGLSYNHYRSWRNAHNASVAIQQQKAAQTKAKQDATVKSDQAALKNVCLQESAAYNALTATAKLKIATQPPNCNLQFVQ